MHIHPEDIKKLYLEWFNNNDWDKKEERDDQEFLELEGELWKKMFPQYANVENEEEGGDAARHQQFFPWDLYHSQC